MHRGDHPNAGRSKAGRPEAAHANGERPNGAPGHLRWRTSSFSGEGNCVEVAADAPNIMLRDSKDPAGPRLAVGAGEWAAFLTAIRAGEFDSTS